MLKTISPKSRQLWTSHSSSDMLAAAVLPSNAPLCVVERLFDKMIGFAMKTRVLGLNQIERLLKTYFMHVTVFLVRRWAPLDGHFDKLERPNPSAATPE